MKNLPTPTKEIIKKYYNKLYIDESASLVDEILTDLFNKTYKSNIELRDVIIKSSVLNTLYSTNIHRIDAVANNIVSIKNIENELKNGNPGIVDRIKKVTIKTKNKKQKYDFLSFASKYCSFNNPTKFPIYDSYVIKMLYLYKKRDKFAVFRKDELRNYKRFKQIIDKFISFYKLEAYSYVIIDKFLWQLGKELSNK